MEWTEILRRFWPSLAAAVALALTFLPKGWRTKARAIVAGIDLPGIGPESPIDAANDCVAAFKAERDAIAAAEADIAERKQRLANAEAVAAKGVAQ